MAVRHARLGLLLALLVAAMLPGGPTALRGVCLLAALVLVVAETAGPLAARLLPEAGPIDRIAAGITLFLAQAILVQNGLGFVGRLNLAAVLMVHTAILIVVTLRLRRFPAAPADTLGPALRGLIGLGPAVLTILLFTTLVMGVSLVNGLRYVPFEEDSLRAHLPIAVEMLKTGRIGAYPALHHSFAAYATSWESWLNWLMMPLGADHLVHLSQWAFLAPGVLCLYGLGRRLGIGPRIAALAPMAFATTPVVWWQLGQCKNDVAVAAAFLAAVHFILLAHRAGGWGALTVAAVAVGLTTGLKGNGPAYALGLSVAALVLLIAARPRWLTLRRLAPAVVAWVAIVMALGGWWFAYKWSVAGNPLGQAGAVSAGPGTSLWSVVRRGDPVPVVGRPGDYLDHLGRAAPFVVVLALPFALVWCLRERGWRLARLIAVPGLIAVVVAIFAVTPASGRVAWNARYGLAAWGLLLVGVAAASGLGRAWAWAAGAALAVIVVDGAYVARPSLVRTAGMLAVSAVGAVVVSLVFTKPRMDAVGRCWYRRPALFNSLLLVLVLIAGIAGTMLVGRHAEAVRFSGSGYGFCKDPVVGESWAFIDAHTDGGGVVAWAGETRIYPLYGRAFRNRVVRAHRTERAEDDPYPWLCDVPDENCAVWLKHLEATGAQWLWCGALWKKDPKKDAYPPQEQRWAEAFPHRFEEVFRNDRAVIYRIKPPGKPGER